jgi:hypothetical protein
MFLIGHDFTGCGKLISGCKKRQGTTLVVPKMLDKKRGL